MQFVTYMPFTLKSLDLDRLFNVPADEIVKKIPILSDQLEILKLTGLVQLTKYDLVATLQHFHKLHTLDICNTEYITPGTCDTIARYCMNLLEFYFTMDFRVRDCRAWIGLLGMDLQHITFTELVDEHLEAYYVMEHDMDEDGNVIYDDSNGWPDLSQNISADDPLNENALLMPIGAPTIQDINPVEVKLDQVSVDNTIANVIEQEQLLETLTQSTSQTEQVLPVGTENDELVDSDCTIPAEDEAEESIDANQNNTDDKPPPTPKRGSVEIKEYGVKRKVSDGKLKFKCPKCGKRTKTRKQQNQHYKDSHDPIMCSNCDKVFNNPASLSIHMYDHMEHRFKCDICEQGFYFAGQLTQHKAVHRKEGKGTFQCMTSNCGKWFIRKGDLVVHIETHKKKEWKCPHCDHITTCEKYLKTHIKSRHETEENDYPYKCVVCNRRFLYRQQLARHKDEHLKKSKS